MKITNTF